MSSLRSVHDEPNSRGMLSVYVYSPDKNRWTRAPYAQEQPTKGSSAPTSLRLLTWNVDFMAPHTADRLKCALDYIQRDVFNCTDGNAPEPCAILLQEIEAEVIPVLLSNEWVRAHFQVTPISKWNWPNKAHYGSITLISLGVPVVSASSLVFANSHMSRNALIVDVQLAGSTRPGTDTTEIVGNEDDGSKAPRAVLFRIRIANVHLESLQQGASARPQQLALVTEALKEAGIKAGLVCGDMNDIMECDKTIPSSLGLSDAYTGDANDSKGHTWGYQPVCSYPPGRLDKILYTPHRGLVVEEPTRVGVGAKTALGAWASDHYGLLTSVSITRE
ncbi:hypothetical protein ACEPAF_8319 [Sanghuangporus sanghuang]|uniref:Endonuclease/exonuclease/phosphatase domain-containing protein n=1 Tax=Sanghuangporus baumii TaxID=108892 RepID=A0A9Q5HRU3_SANBA|nr:hypothetical protein A7U60_g8225 [Sanghuangporus baumii]